MCIFLILVGEERAPYKWCRGRESNSHDLAIDGFWVHCVCHSATAAHFHLILVDFRLLFNRDFVIAFFVRTLNLPSFFNDQWRFAGRTTLACGFVPWSEIAFWPIGTAVENLSFFSPFLNHFTIFIWLCQILRSETFWTLNLQIVFCKDSVCLHLGKREQA